MRRFWLALLAHLLVGLSVGVLLSSCREAPLRPSDFAYADSAFTAALRGTFTPSDGLPRSVAAEISVGAPSEDGGARDVTVSFTAPPALAGVTVRGTATSDGGARAVTFTVDSPYGAVTAAAAHGEYDGFLRFAEALIPVGDVAEVSPTAEDGTHTVTRRSAEGDWEATYLFSDGGGLPLRVTVRRAGEVLELAVSDAGE